MVETHEKKSSGVAKAGLATAAAVGGAMLLGGGLPFGGLARGGFAPPVAFAGPGGYAASVVNPDCGFVTDKDMKYIRENIELSGENSRLRSEQYADRAIGATAAAVYGELGRLKDDICDIKAAQAMESERRACGDEKLLSYVDSNFIKAEKSLNSKHINYHGVAPVIQFNNDCCEG